MQWKIIGIITIILLVIAVGAGIYMKMTQSTESQKAGLITNFTFEPHQTFGCAHYVVPKDFTINNARPNNSVQPVKK